MRIERAVAAALFSVFTGTSVAMADPLAASAGLGGLTRPGRWTPVRVTVTTEQAPWRGTLQLHWGDAHVERLLSFDAPGPRALTFHLRTTSPEPDVRVALASARGETSTVRIPVQILDADAPLDVCIGRPSDDASAARCTTTVELRDLPASARGYDAATDVRLLDANAALPEAQRVALAQWRMMAALDARGDLGLTPQAAQPAIPRGLPRSALRGLLAASGAYLIGLGLVGGAAVRRRWDVAPLALAIASLIATGCAGIYAIGRVGNTRAVVIHHRSVLEQLPGVRAAVFTTRAVAEFPAHDDVELRLDVTDGAIRLTADDPPVDRFDQDGHPIVAGRFGLADRRGLRAEGMLTGEVLALDRRDSALVLRNASAVPLEDCRLADGLRPGRVERLEPGSAVPVEAGAVDVLGPAVTCSMHAAPFAVTAGTRPVTLEGSTIVAAFLAPESAPPDDERATTEPRP